MAILIAPERNKAYAAPNGNYTSDGYGYVNVTDATDLAYFQVRWNDTPDTARELVEGAIGRVNGAAAILSRMQKQAAAAERANLVLNAVSAAAATVASPGSAPSTTGFTNLLPASTGFAANFTATTTASSRVLTSVSSTSGLMVGQPLVEDGSTSAYPANIPFGAVIESISGSTVTMSKAATGSASAITIHAASSLFNIIGGVAAQYGGNFSCSATTVGNSVTPPTARKSGYAGWAIEFETDAANFSTAAATVMLRTFANGANPDSYRIAIDDVYQTSSAQSFGAGRYVTIQFASAGVHKVRIELPGGICPTHLYVTTGAKIWKPRGVIAPRVALFGDSYFSTGASGSWPQNNMGAQLSNLMGWNGDQVAVAGTGYTNDGGSNYTWANAYRGPDLERRDFDAVVVLGSINDAGAGSAAFQAAALTTWQTIRAKRPYAPMFIFGVPTTSNLSNGTALTLEGYLQTAFNTWGDANAWFYPVSGDAEGSWIDSNNSSAYIAGDGSHTTDAGSAYYARRMAAKIRATLRDQVVI